LAPESRSPAFAYTSNTTVAEVARRLRGAPRVALTTHHRADGDAIGSVLALARALHALGRQAHIYTIGRPEPNVAPLVGSTPCTSDEHPDPPDDHDAIVVADTGAWSQLGPLGDWLRRHRQRVICLDHHTHGDDVAALRLVDTSAAATAQVALQVIDHLGVPITGEPFGIGEALFLGLATDTGWFRFANADARAFADAARLMQTGVNNARLYQLVEQTDRPQKMTLAARALGTIRHLRGGAVALMVLRMRDFHETGATGDDVSGLVNLPLSVASVRVSILLTQIAPDHTKVSFRSKPPLEDGTGSSDVNALAMRLGGGGHVHAAGARLPLEADLALAEVVRVVGEERD
jgi:phosphoesterase RecJ-like protein